MTGKEKMMEKIWLSPPHMSGRELDYVEEAFENNWISSVGNQLDQFSELIQERTGSNHVALLASGTAAIHMGLRLLGVSQGDEVLCQSFTFAASANPVEYLGADPCFVGSEPDTWNMDPNSLRRAIEDRKAVTGEVPSAIVPVHLFGIPAKIEEIISVAEEYDIPVLEDAAESLGSTWAGQHTGTFGDAGVLSFNGNKIITTSGGGALISEDEGLIEEAQFLASQAKDDAPHYQHSEIGYNYRMSNILAAIGRGQMETLDDHVKACRRNFEYYFDHLNGNWLEVEKKSGEGWSFNGKGGDGLYFHKEPDDAFSNRWLTTMVVNPGETNGMTNKDILKVLEEENIESRPLWKPMHLQPVYRDKAYYGNGLSEWLFNHGICLPSGSNLSPEDQDRVIKVIRERLK